jgi:NTP pyrophosphatase (non-canonical NTP hydrolase)
MKSKYVPTHYDNMDIVLGYLIEECGEVLQAAGKSIRWGFDSVNPEVPVSQQVTNIHWLLNELDDLTEAIRLVRLKTGSADRSRRVKND